MKELPYFKFYPAEWMKGNITDCSLEAQGLFINICVLYWMKGGDLRLTRIERKFNNCSTAVQELINEEIINVFDDEIRINFLDEQFSQFEILREHKSRAGKASAKKRKTNSRLTGVQQNPTIKRRVDKIRKDKEEIPPYPEFKKYALEKKPLVDLSQLKLKYDSWVELGWVDGHGNKIVNWKSKLLNTLPYLKEAAVGRGSRKENFPKVGDREYGVFDKKGAPMPDSLKERISNIGKV